MTCLSTAFRQPGMKDPGWDFSSFAMNDLRPHIPPPVDDHGWMKGQDGMMEPLWIRGRILPTELTDSIENTMDVDSDESDTDAPCPIPYMIKVTVLVTVTELKCLKGLAQAKIIKKSVILFWLLNMTI